MLTLTYWKSRSNNLESFTAGNQWPLTIVLMLNKPRVAMMQFPWKCSFGGLVPWQAKCHLYQDWRLRGEWYTTVLVKSSNNGSGSPTHAHCAFQQVSPPMFHPDPETWKSWCFWIAEERRQRPEPFLCEQFQSHSGHCCGPVRSKSGVLGIWSRQGSEFERAADIDSHTLEP